jgi:hypothetical protein
MTTPSALPPRLSFLGVTGNSRPMAVTGEFGPGVDVDPAANPADRAAADRSPPSGLRRLGPARLLCPG